MSIKILHLLLSESYGGLELYVCQLIEQQCIRGYQVHSLVLPQSKAAHHLESLQLANLHLHYGSKPQRLSLSNIMQIRAILRKYQIRLLHSHNRLDIWVGSLANLTGLCQHVHSVYMLVTHAKKGLQYQFIYGNPARFVSTSELTNHAILANLPVSPEKIRLIAYGRELAKYTTTQRQRIRQQHQAKPDQIVVATLSRIDKQKGIREFVESYLQLPQSLQKRVVYWVIGEPSILKSTGGQVEYEAEGVELENFIEGFIEQHQLNGKIKRIPFQKNYIDYLGSMDIFVLPSYNEMYSLSVIEAMLMHVPVIGTNTGGTPEQISTDRGLQIQPRNSHAIAQAVSKLAENPDLAAQFAKNAYKWAVNRHDLQNTLQQFEQLYQEIL